MPLQYAILRLVRRNVRQGASCWDADCAILHMQGIRVGATHWSNNATTMDPGSGSRRPRPVLQPSGVSGLSPGVCRIWGRNPVQCSLPGCRMTSLPAANRLSIRRCGWCLGRARCWNSLSRVMSRQAAWWTTPSLSYDCGGWSSPGGFLHVIVWCWMTPGRRSTSARWYRSIGSAFLLAAALAHASRSETTPCGGMRAGPSGCRGTSMGRRQYRGNYGSEGERPRGADQDEGMTPQMRG